MSQICPNCGTELDAPTESVGQQLAALVESGLTGDMAAWQVVAGLPKPHRDRMFSVLRREAHLVERERHRRVEKAAIGSAERWERSQADARARLLAIPFSLEKGEITTWGLATPEQHERREALLDRDIAGITATKARHRLARKLIAATPGAKCLNDVAGGERVLLDDEDASGEAAASLSVGARESVTSADGVRAGRRTAGRKAAT